MSDPASFIGDQPGQIRARIRTFPRIFPALREFVPSWPLIVGLVFFIRALAQPMALLNDPDTYLHIAAGRWMLAHAALPVHDPFSHSLAGAVWVPHEWLAEIILAATYDLAGWSGLVLLTAAAFAVSVALLTRFLLRWAEPFSALIVACLGAALVQGHLLARPHLLALPLLVVWSGALFAARDTGSGPPFRLLPVMVLWANLHGGFMFGLALALFLDGRGDARAGNPRPGSAPLGRFQSPGGRRRTGHAERRRRLFRTVPADRDAGAASLFRRVAEPRFSDVATARNMASGARRPRLCDRCQTAAAAAGAAVGAVPHGARTHSARRASRSRRAARHRRLARPANRRSDPIGADLHTWPCSFPARLAGRKTGSRADPRAQPGGQASRCCCGRWSAPTIR